MISMMVACDENRLIGAHNKLPWHFKEDLHYFKKVTTGHDLLMGRLTFESILSYGQHPLPDRHHYVATRATTYDFESVTTVLDIESFVKSYPKEKELFIIGGASIYAQLLPFVERLYVTHVKHCYEGDAWFPAIDLKTWHATKRNETDDLCFMVYERKSN
ncbi:MAG: dihydrofolate reductase [Defluviitaleaceae bacterium]|nr:dihydrofolate reductase [Defluviitaleaceae bacterium]